MKRLHRSDSDKVLGGVCGGLGEYMGIDPLILRVAFVILAMMNGVGLTLYVLMWVFMPRAEAEHTGREEVVRQNVAEIRDRARELGAEARDAFGGGWSDSNQSNQWMLIGGGVLVVVGLLILLQNFGLLWSFVKLWPLVLIAIGAMMLLNNLRDR